MWTKADLFWRDPSPNTNMTWTSIGTTNCCLREGSGEHAKENLNAWPTTFFVGRNGLVRSIHTGFTSQASGELDSRLKDSVRNEIGQLLSENVHVAKGGN
jgi:hypothetical protein